MTTVHLLGLPHVISRPEFSRCPFTQNLLRFPAMLAPFGYRCIHYGVEGAEIAGAECVTALDERTFRRLRGAHPFGVRDDATLWVPEVYDEGKPGNVVYQEGVIRELLPRLTPGDIVVFPFSTVHNRVAAALPPGVVAIETGIGYEATPFLPFQVFVSHAWYAWHRGRQHNLLGDFYHFVIGNSFDVGEWTVQPRPEPGYVLYFGRCIENKGLRVVWDLAQARPDLRFVLCGQGAKEWATLPNMEARPQVWGRERDALYAGASVVLMPTQYFEAFGNVCAEAQLCGRPVLTTDWGAFPEILTHGVAGYRCRTLGDFLAGLELAPTLDPQQIRAQAEAQFALPVAGAKYHKVFRQCQERVSGAGWASRTQFIVDNAGVTG